MCIRDRYYYGNTLENGYFVSTVGNNQLKWETVEDWNVGVDMSFLEDVYKRQVQCLCIQSFLVGIEYGEKDDKGQQDIE